MEFHAGEYAGQRCLSLLSDLGSRGRRGNIQWLIWNERPVTHLGEMGPAVRGRAGSIQWIIRDKRPVADLGGMGAAIRGRTGKFRRDDWPVATGEKILAT